jgi:hypothetical protein
LSATFLPLAHAPLLARRKRRVLYTTLALAMPLLLMTAATRTQANPILGLVVIGFVVAAWHKQMLAWPTLLGYVLLVILFIPIRRFTLAGGGPVSIEPYRVLILVVLFCWGLALLGDPQTRWRKTGFDGPVMVFIFATLIGLALNVHRVVGGGLTSAVLKKVTFFASFLLVMYFVSSILKSRKQLDRTLMVLVFGGALVAFASLVEWRTNYNFFNHLNRYIPLLHFDPAGAVDSPNRGGRVRAYASAQHPIALGAALVLIMPLAIYLHQRTKHPVWLGCAAMLVFGALATGSRTAALMLMVELVCFFWMKREETVRLLPMLLPLFVACQVLMPGTLGTFKAIIFPSGSSVIAEQEGGKGMGTGRVADLGPSLAEWSRQPFFGQGFGTRLTSQSDEVINARILDDQWLGTLLEVGAVGWFALMWLYIRATRACAREAKRDKSSRGWLLAALGAGIMAFNVGMFTYDAYSFIQVTFLSFILIGFAAVIIRQAPDEV